MGSICFVEASLCPSGVNSGYNETVSAVNAVAIVTNRIWQDVVKSLIGQAHERANLPTYHTCVTDMFRENGFAPLNGGPCSIGCLIERCKERDPKSKIIMKLSSGYYAAVPDDKTGNYLLKGFKLYGSQKLEGRFIKEAWIYHEGENFKTGIYKKTERNVKNPSGVSMLSLKNMNPENKHVGDCVIRGLSAVYGCTWHEAIDYIAQANNYTDPVLNAVPNINLVLLKLGLERHKEIKRANKLLTGAQFCDLMNYTYHNGERIFAYIGKNHCAAVLPFDEDGTVKYKIQDTWDSTSKTVREYWVYKEKKTEKAEKPETKIKSLNVNSTIMHPRFGKGVILAERMNGNSKIFEVQFEKAGRKSISQNWLESFIK